MTERIAGYVRSTGALLLILGGSVHLQQWFRVFRHQDVGALFLLNVLASVLIGGALLVVADRRLVLAGMALASGSLVAIVVSRTVGLLGFSATDYGTPEIEAIVVEVMALASLGLCLIGPRAPQSTATAPSPR